MKTKFLILTILVFLILPFFSQEIEIIYYPHTLQEFYKKLDEAFPDDTEITSMVFSDWLFLKSSTYSKFIKKWVNSEENPVFIKNINPKSYKLNDISYASILTESYWFFKNQQKFEFDRRLYDQEQIDFPPQPDYPHTLQEFYEKLDEEFSNKPDLLDALLQGYYYFSDHFDALEYTIIRCRISDWLNYKENAIFFQNINPNNYRVHKESYSPLLLSSYLSYKTGKSFDLELAFECDDRYLNSYTEPTKFPLNDLVWDNSWLLFEYEYKTSSTYEAIYDYRRPSDPTDSNVYIYSYHFGWIVLTEKEYNDMLASPDWKTILWDYFQTKEKLVF
jgi:hypothetical protein